MSWLKLLHRRTEAKQISPRASSRFDHLVEAIRFEDVFLCKRSVLD